MYRSVTFFISALARFNNIFANSSFTKIRKLVETEKPNLDEEFAHDLEFAVACYVRLEIYMEKDGQEGFQCSDDNSQELIHQMIQLMGTDTPMDFLKIVMELQREVCFAIGKSNSNFVQWSPELDRLLVSFWLQNYDFTLWEATKIYNSENC